MFTELGLKKQKPEKEVPEIAGLKPEAGDQGSAGLLKGQDAAGNGQLADVPTRPPS